MKKNDLIKLLNSIEGNPDIVLWNGFVRDYQDISKELVKGDLVKISLDWYLETCRMERCRKEKIGSINLLKMKLVSIKITIKSLNMNKTIM